jgi:glycosyltransferase involved in cell wall biosynthesis
MKVNVITGVRPAGPYYFGKNLAEILRKKGIDATWVYQLHKVLSSPFWQTADIVHSSGVPLSYRLWRKPLVLTIKGEYPIEKRVWRLLYPLAIRKADIITTPSHFLKERLNLQDAIVIPNAIFPEQFKTVEHAEKDTINLVTVTGLQFKDKARGILDILEILSSLPGEVHKHIKYSVVGGGPYLEQVIREAKRYLVNVEFHGALPSPKQTLQSSDIFIYYSHHDNFPNVILEAMACGLPVVTNDVGAVSEIFENGKDGFIGTNHDSYGEYLLNLISNLNLRAKVGKEARKTVESKFNWENVIEQYIDIYHKLV